MGDNRSAAYWEDGRLVIRASAFGGCIGALVRAGLGITPEAGPKRLIKAFAEGNRAEPLIVEELHRRGMDMVEVLEAQAEYELHVGNVTIRCHPDGVELNGDGARHRVLEIKALKPTFPRDFRPYLWQASIEMHATGLPLLWVYGPKDQDGNVDLARLELVPVDMPYFSLLHIKRRALAIYRAVTEADIPTCDWVQFPCGYWTDDDALCGRGAKADAEELWLGEELERAYLVAKGVKEAADRDFKAAQERIKAVLADKEGERYKAGKLRMVKVAGSKRFDKDKARAAGVEVDDFMVSGREYWRIDVEEG